MADDDADRADGLGGGETTAPPNPNAAAGAATNGGETSRVTSPEADATIASNGGETTRATGPDAAASAATNGGETSRATVPEADSTTSSNGGETTQATGPEADATAATNGGESTNPTEADGHRALHDYAARYSGRTLVARMIFIAERCGVEAMEQEALEMALQEVKGVKDVMLYCHIYTLINGRFASPPYDQAWVDRVTQDFNQSLLFVEADLQRHEGDQRRTMIGYVELGDLYYGHGHLAEAFKSYIRMEDFLSSPEDIVHVCMKCIIVNLELQQYDHALRYINMANSIEYPVGTINIAKLQAVTGLSLLGKGEYKLAALQFVDIGPELGSNNSEVISPQDVAIYGALCGLASFVSAEMKVKVMDNIKFRSFLQLEPQVQQLVSDFFDGRHTSLMKHLEHMKPRLLLDIHLSNHVKALYFVISQKSGFFVVEDSALENIVRTSFLAPNAPNENEPPINAEEPPLNAEEPPLNGEGEEESAHEEAEPQIVIVSNFVLPNEFDDERLLLPSDHYKFVNAKELLLSLGKRRPCWAPRLHAHAVLINASLFVWDSADDNDGRFDGRMVVVSDTKFSIFEVEYTSYTSSRKPLKEIRIKDKEDSVIDRFQIKGNIWTRRRVCLKNDHRFHLLQWRKTSGLGRTQVQPPEAAAPNENNAELHETMKSLVEQLKDHSNIMAQTTQTMVQLDCSLAETRKTVTTTTMGAGGVPN